MTELLSKLVASRTGAHSSLSVAGQLGNRSGVVRRLAFCAWVGATIVSTGCAALVTEQVNKKYPPVSAERRQLGAIRESERALSALVGRWAARDTRTGIRQAGSPQLLIGSGARRASASIRVNRG